MKNLANPPYLKGYKNIAKVFKYYKKHIGLFSGFLVFSLLGALISLVNPIVIGVIIEDISVLRFDRYVYLAIIMFAVGTLVHVINLINVRFYKQLENKVKLDIKLDIMKTAMNIKMKNYDELGNGVFITRLTSDLNVASYTFINIAEKSVNFFSKLGFLVLVMFLNIYVGTLLFLFVVAKFLFYKIRVFYFARLKRIVHKKAEIVNSTVGETIRGIKDIKTLNCEYAILQKIAMQQEDYNKADNKEWYVGIFLYHLAEFVQTIFDLAFILLSAYLIMQNSLSAAVFYTIYIYKGNIMSFANTLGDMQRYLKEAELCAFRVFELQNPNVFGQETFGDKSIENFEGRIEFEKVSFSYDKKNPVLKDMSFVIEPNQTVSFVGESGCGKSTIINLISKLYDIEDGKILLDGENLNELSREFLKNNISVITQLPYIFNLSIRENFQLVKPDVSDEEIMQVCKKAGLTTYIKNLSEGLDTVVGEGGGKASGGQRQRLSIARALLTNSKILVFDESTSALDNRSQNVIMKTIDKLKNEKTIIIIAHRLNTIENCDKLFMLGDGKVLGEGTHLELLETCTAYQDLYYKVMEEYSEE